jgi:hypothetical protein
MDIEFPNQGRFSRDWLEQHPEETQRLLAQCKGRYPLCRCREPGLPLYIARRQRLYLARLPNTGPQHAPQCPAYEPDPSLCGWSVYSASALRESLDGKITIKLNAPLLIRASAATPPVTAPATSIERTTRDALALTGLLHLLWERSEFNRWHPGMRDRRRYRQWRKYLLDTAQGIYLRREPLTRHLYLPERYVPEQALEIEARRQQALAHLGKTASGSPMRILVLAKLRAIVGATGLQLAHLPHGFVIGLAPEMLARLRQLTAFAWLDGHRWHPEFQVFVLLTMQRARDLAWTADEITGVVTAREFIPLFSIEDAIVSRRLIDAGRTFYKPLPYDAPATRVPNFILTDTGATSVPLEIIPADGAAAASSHLRLEHYQTTQQRVWQWDVSASSEPPAFVARE